ncbi:MAG: hypothetical protein VX346_26055 [Planctomycetota bacterium]|nr:hypothetical protein [Planctomycetota bacterium]
MRCFIDNPKFPSWVSAGGLCVVSCCWLLPVETSQAGCGDYVVAAGESMVEHPPAASEEPVDTPPCEGPQCKQGRSGYPAPMLPPGANCGLGKACLALANSLAPSGLPERVEWPRFFSRVGFPGALLRPPRV